MKLIIFFTYGVSLADWEKTGILSRELEIYRELSKKGVEITFFTYGGDVDLKLAKEQDFNLKIFPLYKYKNKNKFKLLDILGTLVTIYFHRQLFKKFQIYKSNQFWGSWLPLFCKFIFKGKFILRCGFEFNKFAKYNRSKIFILLAYLMSHLLYRFADKIIVASVEDKYYIAKKFFFNSKGNDKKINLVPNLINTKKFDLINICPMRDILVIARLEKQKNIKMAIQVALILNLSLTIIGRGSLKNEICEFASGVKDFIYLESVNNDEIPIILNNHKIYLTTSLYEGNPKSLLEAMSTKRLVIAKNSPGISSIIKHNFNGFLFKDLDNLTPLIDNIVTSKNTFEIIKNNARKYVVENHELKIISNLEMNLYYNLINII